MFVYSYQDPFEDYKTRLAKKLARKAEGGEKNDTEAKESNKVDSINWFGVKLAKESGTASHAAPGSGGVGKYLNLKRPRGVKDEKAVVDLDDSKDGKKHKIGFGEFEGW